MIRYIHGLNGLRAIAVFMVILAHRLPAEHVLLTFPLGDYGVNIFFVLSGFLISRQLFLEGIIYTTPLTKTLFVFFFRRSLRIFPIYYLLLLFLYLTPNSIGDGFSENFEWYVFYASNYLNYFDNRWYGSMAHLWSLAVEEQFYLIGLFSRWCCLGKIYFC